MVAVVLLLLLLLLPLLLLLLLLLLMVTAAVADEFDCGRLLLRFRLPFSSPAYACDR